MTQIALNLTLYSHPKNIAEVEPYVSQVVKKYEINQELYGNMLITLTEAVSNAIIHGNSAKVEKKVIVSTDCSPKKILFTVQDEGTGFDPDSLPDSYLTRKHLNAWWPWCFLDATTFRCCHLWR